MKIEVIAYTILTQNNLLKRGNGKLIIQIKSFILVRKISRFYFLTSVVNINLNIFQIPSPILRHMKIRRSGCTWKERIITVFFITSSDKHKEIPKYLTRTV